MNTDLKETDRGTYFSNGDEYFSATMLAELNIEGLPSTRAGIYKTAAREGWPVVRVPGRGAKDGVKYFLVPDNILSEIKKITGEQVNYSPSKSSKLITESDTNICHEVNSQQTTFLSDFVFVPKYDVRASAGHGAMIHSEQIVDHLAFKKVWVRSELGCCEKNLALITVKGDSMEPTLSSQDLILIDLRKNQITDNAVYVLQYDGSLLVKRIQRKMNGTVIIKSDNPEYENEELSAEQAKQLKVLGMVVWYGRKM